MSTSNAPGLLRGAQGRTRQLAWLPGPVSRGMFAALAFLVATTASPLAATERVSREYSLKASFLHKLLYFTEWPAEPSEEQRQRYRICILEEQAFRGAFAPVEGKTVRDRSVQIRHLPKDVPPRELLDCHILFVGSSVENPVHELLRHLSEHPVLTVGSQPSFAENGGIIELRIEDNRLRFRVHKGLADDLGIHFRAKLLRLSDQVLRQSSESRDDVPDVGDDSGP